MEEILNIFEHFRMTPTSLDVYESEGKALLQGKIEKMIQRNEPLRFVMLGYPMKSSNSRDKVLGQLPDMAEEVSLKNFGKFNSLVTEVYSKGIEINIVNDGFVFNDLLEIEDRTVEQYQEGTLDMSKGMPINYFNLKDFYSSSLPEARNSVMSHFGISEEELQKRILFDVDVNYLYRGMMRFMEEELAPKSFPSKTQLHLAAKKLTRNMMMRNEAYSNLVKKEFSDYIRLSMHPSINNGAKYSFQLIPSKNAHHSPWHSSLVIHKNGEYETLHKKDAIEKGYELVYQNNQPFYFLTK